MTRARSNALRQDRAAQLRLNPTSTSSLCQIPGPELPAPALPINHHPQLDAAEGSAHHSPWPGRREDPSAAGDVLPRKKELRSHNPPIGTHTPR